MATLKAKIWIARISAFVWGYSFIHLFKYILDNIYPFWSQTTNISLFAYILIFVAWLSYTLFFNFRPYRNFIPRLVYHVIFLANAAIFYILIVKMGEQKYLYFFPLYFTFQFFIYFFLFTSMFPAIMRHRISILAGILPGLVTYPYIGNIYIDIFLPAVVYLMPYNFFTEMRTSHSKSQLRMLPLRQSVDLLRYIFLGLAFYGIFDIYREQFYLSAFLIALGPALSSFLQFVDKKKHHIKYGMYIFAIFFIAGAILYRNLPIAYWAASGFCFLTIWEGLYFKKTAEGDLKREQMLSGTALVLVICFYFISPEWVVIISAILIVLIQSRIAVYIAKSYRKTLSVLFGLSLFAWLGAITFSYTESFKRDFFSALTQKKEHAPVPLSVLDLGREKNVPLASNLFPEEVIKEFSAKHTSSLIYVRTWAPDFLFEILRLHKLHPDVQQIYDLKDLKPYKTKTGQKYIFEFLNLYSIQNVFLYESESPGVYFNEFTSNVFKTSITRSDFNKEEIFEFGTSLANWYSDHGHYDFALYILKDLMQNMDKIEVLRQIAHIYGITGDTENQIEYR
ncbi:MAG: hypothetical protein OEV66_07530, partial [Spirochaetia bacterium]|nr:hypothetical protein [Spirochaetia bacterium]